MTDFDSTPQTPPAPEYPELKPAFEPKNPNKNLKIFGFIAAGGFAFICIVCIIFLLYQYFDKSAKITALTADNQAAQEQIATMTTRQAETDSELATTQSDLETSQKDLTDANTELDKKKEQITELNSKVSKLTTEKSSLTRAYNAMFCKITIPEDKISGVTDNDELQAIIEAEIEAVVGFPAKIAFHKELVEGSKLAMFALNYGDYGVLLFTTWDKSETKIESIFSLDGDCFFYKKDYLPESSASNS